MSNLCMLEYTKKVFFFKIKESWFKKAPDFSNYFTLSVSRHVKTNIVNQAYCIKEHVHTIELSLLPDEPIILKNFSKQVRQQVKISQSEGTECFFENDVKKFVTFFNDFASQKKTFLTSEQRIIELGNSVKISFAINDSNILAAHSYLVDPDQGIVRHLHSATKRLDKKLDKNLIGRANKYLMVNDILYFKNEGYTIFDFGGYAKSTNDKSLEGINNYKLLFGGLIVESNDYYSYSYWFLKKVVKILGLSGKL